MDQRKKIKKSKLRRIFNYLEMCRRNRILDQKDKENKEKQASIRANTISSKESSSIISSTDISSSDERDNEPKPSTSRNIDDNIDNFQHDHSYDQETVLVSKTDCDSSLNLNTDYSSSIDLPTTNYKESDNIFYTTNTDSGFTNDSFSALNICLRDTCIFNEFISLKINQFKSKRSPINSFEDLEAQVQSCFRFLQKSENNFKHFKNNLIKYYKELCEHYNKTIADSILLECDDSEDDVKDLDNSKEIALQPPIHAINPVIAISKIDDGPLHLSNYDGWVRDVVVSLERAEEGAQNSDNVNMTPEKNDTENKGSNTNDIEIKEHEKQGSDTKNDDCDSDKEISNLIDLNNLKRKRNEANDLNDKPAKITKTDKDKSCKNKSDERELSSNIDSEVSDNKDEQSTKSDTSENDLNDIALQEIMELSENSDDMELNDENVKLNTKLKDNDFKDDDTLDEEVKVKKDEKVSSDDEKFRTRSKAIENILSIDSTSGSDNDNSTTLEIITNQNGEVCYVGSSDDEEEIKGRKNIRSIINKENLEYNTQLANKEERKRLEQLSLKDDNLGLNNQVSDFFVLDRDPTTKEVIISVHPLLNKDLKDHQREGIKFMWDSCYDTVECIKNKKPGNGCILAHCMGLGKTLQVIAFAHTVMRHKLCQTNTTLVVCPSSVTLNWRDEIEKWLSPFSFNEKRTYILTSSIAPNDRCKTLRKWKQDGGFLLLSYDMYRNIMKTLESTDNVYENRKKCYKETLRDPGPDIVFLDEGHVLKNEKTMVRVCLEEIRTRRRVILTGTPMQNNLREYFWMVHFVKPYLLGSYKEFTNRFANPIRNGQHKNSNTYDIKLMKKRSHVLHKLLKGTIQRKEVGVLTKYLPKKYEYVLFLRPTKIQEVLYNYFLTTVSKARDSQFNMITAKFFSDFQCLKRIWTHPYALVDFLEKSKNKQLVNDLEIDVDEIIGDVDSHSIRTMISKLKKSPLAAGWWQEKYNKESLNCINSSSKLSIMFDIIQECQQTEEKVLVFTSSLSVLNAIEHFLKVITSVTNDKSIPENIDHQIVGKYRGNWLDEKDYFRFDGQLPIDSRRKYCNIFNNPQNKRARLFLVSTRAGGLGLNMIGANRVIILDVSWNPAVDTQSIFRTYRLMSDIYVAICIAFIFIFVLGCNNLKFVIFID